MNENILIDIRSAEMELQDNKKRILELKEELYHLERINSGLEDDIAYAKRDHKYYVENGIKHTYFSISETYESC